MENVYCPSCHIGFNHSWRDFLVSHGEVDISACRVCGFRHVEVTVFDPDHQTRTVRVAEGKPPEGEIPVVTVTFDREELCVIPEVTFSHYRAPAIKDIPEAVPSALAKDCREAHMILWHSPRSAALLARRIIQQVLKEHGHPQWKLERQIKSLADSGELSSIDIKKLHAVRNLGNISAHTARKADTLLDVESHEAELCLQIVDELFAHYYEVPAEVEHINRKIEG